MESILNFTHNHKTKIYYSTSYKELQKQYLSYINKNYTFTIIDNNLPSSLKSLFKNPKTKILDNIKGGESIKSLEKLELQLRFLLENGCKRHHHLIGIGGGSLTDSTGLVASLYMRGIKCTLIPTTLLAQVDASIGGKNAINFANYKNMVGTFYQPHQIFICTEIILNHSDKMIQEGLAEILKYALIADINFLKWLESNAQNIINKDASCIAHCIFESVKIKSNIVTKDHRESNIRAILNFGHTYAHSLETISLENSSLYQVTHGEAVSLGMIGALILSKNLGLIKETTINRVIKLMKNLNMPLKLPLKYNTNNIISHIAKDKKNIDSKYRFIVLEKLGKAKIVELNPSSSTLKQSIDEWIKTLS